MKKEIPALSPTCTLLARSGVSVVTAYMATNATGSITKKRVASRLYLSRANLQVLHLSTKRNNSFKTSTRQRKDGVHTVDLGCMLTIQCLRGRQRYSSKRQHASLGILAYVRKGKRVVHLLTAKRITTLTSRKMSCVASGQLDNAILQMRSASLRIVRQNTLLAIQAREH